MAMKILPAIRAKREMMAVARRGRTVDGVVGEAAPGRRGDRSGDDMVDVEDKNGKMEWKEDVDLNR
jgi:hypothetical protein